MPILSKFALQWAKRKGAPVGAPKIYLAAAAAIVVAAAVIAAPQAVVAAAVAQQENQNDDPADVAAAEIIVTHITYLQKFFTAEPLIPCYSAPRKMCGPGN